MTYYLVILLGLLHRNGVFSYESGSAEANKIEISPYYDTIIFGDVADILNEFDNGNNPLEAIISSGSESEENVEDLLSEYQNYLDKAHKQKTEYLEKNRSNTKNKVPLIRHERFSKGKTGVGVKYDDLFYNAGYYNPNVVQQPYNSPVDFYLPQAQNFKLIKPEFPTLPRKDINEEMLPFDKKNSELPNVLKQRPEALNPIKKPCKMCMLNHEGNHEQNKLPSDSDSKLTVLNSDHWRCYDSLAAICGTNSVDIKKSDENTLNIRIKVDIQLPKSQDSFGRFVKNRSREEDASSKETSLNVPFPYSNFPIPMNLFGYKKTSAAKYNRHELSHHKKKKSRPGNNNKKHKKKVKLTWSNINAAQFVEPASFRVPHYEETLNLTDVMKRENDTQQAYLNDSSPQVTDKTEIRLNDTNIAPRQSEAESVTETQSTEKNIYVMVNISSTTENITEESHKENSVETDYTTANAVILEKKDKLISGQRVRRDVGNDTLPVANLNSTPTITPIIVTEANNVAVIPLLVETKNDGNDTKKAILKESKSVDIKKSEKILSIDEDLTFWPESIQNLSTVVPSGQNITSMIVERENQKAKLNMTKEAIRNNHTKALEKAIFGDVNWDDVDTVAPVFMSFVGKYLNGVLTFCSQNVCHSMKCSDKACVHRTCKPEERWNQRGHCVGSNSTDSVATLESIMDLPSNVVFEIVDILQDKMLGKMYGSMTLCISTKCVSFVTSKRNFLKSKCVVKELSSAGQCPIAKKAKLT